MKPNLENLKEYTNNASLTSEEKFDIFQNLKTYTAQNPVKTKYSIFMRHSVAYASIFALLIGTTATSFAAEEALPGDILYPIKTNINESVVKSLSITKEQKARTTVNLVNKRLSELTELVATDEDSSEKVSIIATKLEEHRTEFERIMHRDDLEESDTPEESEIYDTLESVIESHLDILEEINQQKDEDDDTENLTENTTLDPITVNLTATSSEEVSADEMLKTQDSDQDEDIAIKEILNFSSRLAPLLLESKSKNINATSSEQIKLNVRNQIIEDTEHDLEIDIQINNN